MEGVRALLAIYIVILCLNLLFFFFNKKNRFVLFLSFLFLLVLIAGNDMNPDYKAYESFFETGHYPDSMEPLFVKMAKWFNGIGGGYNQFVLFVTLCCFVIIILCFKKYTDNFHLIICFYMTYMLFLDTTQIRNMIMITLYTLGLVLLSKKKRLLYILIILFTSLFHRSSLILLFMVYISPETKMSKRVVRFLGAIIAIVCFATFLNGNRIPYIDFLVERFLSDYEDKKTYFDTVTRLGFLTSFVCQWGNIFLSKVASQYIKKYDTEKRWTDFAEVVYLAVCSSSFAMPLTMMNSNFSRYFRINNLAIYLLITLVFIIYQRNKENGLVAQKGGIMINQKLSISLSAYFLVVIFVHFCWMIFKQEPGLVNEILQNNIFFD